MQSQPEHFVGEAYGLAIASDIALPDLAPCPANSIFDVELRQGFVEAWDSDDPFALTPHLRAEQGRLWFDIPGKLAMRIEEGRSIVYRPHPDMEEDEVRLFLLGSGLGAILMQRGQLVLHANAIAMPGDGAIVCFGASGAGKSTTAAALMQRGYDILTDDVCAIGSGNEIRRGVPRLKLWDDAARQLGMDTSPFARLRGAHDKWNIPLRAEAPEARQPGLFVELALADGASVETRPLSGSEKFAALRNNVYRHELCRPLGIEPTYLHRFAQIASATPMVRITRPPTGSTIEEVVDTILRIYDPVGGTTKEDAG